MATEMFDMLDCAGRKTGTTIARDEAHRTGAWHGAFHCLIIYEHHRRPCVLFQKRSAAKMIAPGKFDVSVGGHYAAGEDAVIAGPREIREELGLSVPFSNMVSVGRRVFAYCFMPGIIEQEFQDIFLYPCVGGPGDLVLQAEEVDAVIELDVESGISLFSGAVSRATAMLVSPGKGSAVVITTDDFVPCIDSYYLKLLLLVRQYFKGERDMLVI
jgi:isopentenyl-diphosphate Delta-isomerase